MKLIDDPDQGVRGEAYNALGEFPSSNNEGLLLSRLVSDDRAMLSDVAYSLHSGSTNALLHMLSIARASTNRPVRTAILGALAFRDELQRFESLRKPRSSFYGKRSAFNSIALGMAVRVTDAPDYHDFDRIRSNIISTGLPHVYATIGRTNTPLTSRKTLVE